MVLWSDWLVFCDYGFSLSALWCPLTTPTVLLGFLLPWTWGISSQLLQQSVAAAPYLGWGVSPHGRPPDLEGGVAPLGPPAPTPNPPGMPINWWTFRGKHEFYCRSCWNFIQKIKLPLLPTVSLGYVKYFEVKWRWHLFLLPRAYFHPCCLLALTATPHWRLASGLSVFGLSVLLSPQWTATSQHDKAPLPPWVIHGASMNW